MRDALRDKRLRFGIENHYRVFLREKQYSVFFTDALVLSNPPIGPESNNNANEAINLYNRRQIGSRSY